MLSFSELSCSECEEVFPSAAKMLKHFAYHVKQPNKPNVIKKEQEMKIKKYKNTKIPDLFPISKLKKSELPLNANVKQMLRNIAKEEDMVDSGIEDFVNPLNYCEVTISESEEKSKSNMKVNKILNNSKSNSNRKKYVCSYCQRLFGWSTDLKRHTLIHTGDRPFKCTACDCSFTRKFLLQKHQIKRHPDDKSLEANKNNKKKLPILSPLKPLRRSKTIK